MNKIKKNIIIFCCIASSQIYASSNIESPTRQRRLLPQIPETEDYNVGLPQQELEIFCKALQANEIKNYFKHLEEEKIRQLARSTITVYDKQRGPNAPHAKFIPTLLYALTYNNDAGFYAAKILLNHGANRLKQYNKQNALQIAQENNAPKSLIEALKTKEHELQRQPEFRLAPFFSSF